jgi:hypothetical protein
MGQPLFCTNYYVIFTADDRVIHYVNLRFSPQKQNYLVKTCLLISYYFFLLHSLIRFLDQA